MSEGFLASWSLFGVTYLTGLLAAAALAQVGVWVVAREQIFLGAAVAQASTLGVAVALWAAGFGGLGHLLEGEIVPALFAVAASIFTAASVTTPARSSFAESPEAKTGLVFLFATALPMLLLAQRPHGLEELERVLFSTLLAARSSDVVAFALLSVVGVAITLRYTPQLLLFSLDPEMAEVSGVSPNRVRLAIALWLGLTVGLAIRATGTLFTFGLLVLPALLARGWVREVRTLVWVAPALGVTATFIGLWLGHAHDWPPAHATVLVLTLGAGLRLLLRRR